MENLLDSLLNDPVAMLNNMTLHLGSVTKIIMIVAAVVFGLIAAAMVICTTVFNKKYRVLAIITAIMQPVGLLASVGQVIAYSMIDFSKLVSYGTGSTYEDAYNNALDGLLEYLLGDYLISLILLSICSMLMFASLIITFIYAIKLTGFSPKVPAILAIVVCVLRWLFVAPLDQISTILSVLGIAPMQQSPLWTVMYFVIFMIVPALLLGQSLIAKFAKKGSEQAE